MTRSHAFSRAYWRLHVFALSFDWCNGLTVCVICEWSERLQSLWFCFTTLNRPSSIYQCSIIDQRLSAQNCIFFKFNFLCLSIPKRDIKGYKENATKHRSLSWKPQCHVRMLIQPFQKRLLLWSMMRDAWSMFHSTRRTNVDSYCEREFQAENK